MQLKENLNQIKTTKLKLDLLEERLVEIRDRAIGDGSPAIDKLNIMTSLPPDPMAEAVIEYTDLLDDYHKLKRDYYLLRRITSTYIKSHIHNKEHQTLLFERFFEFKSYGQIGHTHGMNYQQAKKMIGNIIHSMEKRG